MTATLRKEGSLYITFGAYLKQLDATEGQKPVDQRRAIPSLKELADVVGVHQVTMTNIANGKVDRLNLETVRLVLDEMWRRGFHPQLTDFIKYNPPESD